MKTHSGDLTRLFNSTHSQLIDRRDHYFYTACALIFSWYPCRSSDRYRTLSLMAFDHLCASCRFTLVS
ncbi:hypothetical protein ROHU_027842 [Labeo rohita]|uniref:Uncharacterized protein n=1 Tax=Labeo rohita TaxID=84645 RepID=A0A498M4L2_LABRO|nr:hypothetical protein ROHU_027842 [Labeo rohita]